MLVLPPPQGKSLNQSEREVGILEKKLQAEELGWGVHTSHTLLGWFSLSENVNADITDSDINFSFLTSRASGL